MSPFLLHAVIAHEDAGFVAHHGFAPSEIQVALVRNLIAGRYVQGASTITMQLVKNVFLHREKTLARKLQEVLLTWWTERVFSKERILELYLNVIEYGPSVYGIRHAADHYFGRAPGELSVAESAFLATILPSPKLFHAAYEDGSPSPRLRERLRVFLRRLADRGRIDAAALEAGLADVESMTFHREGAERPPPRALVGTARALPFAMVAEDATGWLDEADDAPDPSAFSTADEARGADDDVWSSDAE
jgi:membrane peptidoglycan carboxypeptidase